MCHALTILYSKCVCVVLSRVVNNGWFGSSWCSALRRGGSGMAERNTWPAGSDGRQIHELCIPASITQRRMISVHSNAVGVARSHRYAVCLGAFSGWCFSLAT